MIIYIVRLWIRSNLKPWCNYFITINLWNYKKINFLEKLVDLPLPTQLQREREVSHPHPHPQPLITPLKFNLLIFILNISETPPPPLPIPLSHPWNFFINIYFKIFYCYLFLKLILENYISLLNYRNEFWFFLWLTRLNI